MAPRIAISVSYYGKHRKGDGQVMDPVEHEDMLYRTIAYLSEDMRAHNPLVHVCGSGCDRPFNRCPPDCQYTGIWEPFETGNPDGSWWAICQGIQFAQENSCDYLIHSCEDVLPHRGVMADMVYRMHNESLDYIGHLWRRQGELATQFFGCRPAVLNDLVQEYWTNIGHVANEHGPEAALGILFGTYGINDYAGTRANVGIIEHSYFHSHTYGEYLKALEQMQ